MSFYANPSPTFQPAMRLITGITQADPAVVTTSFDHDYRTGDIVRIYVPEWYGMTQLDKIVCEITVLTSDTFSIDQNSTSYYAFTTPSTPLAWYISSGAHVVPVGEINSNLGAAVQNVL